MAVQNFTLPEVNCPAGQTTVSPSTVMSSNPLSAMIRLTSTEWAAKAGLGTVRFGTQASVDGVNFVEWMTAPPFTCGAVGKDGLPPAIRLTGGDMANYVGFRVRMFAEVTGVDIKLGAAFTITT